MVTRSKLLASLSVAASSLLASSAVFAGTTNGNNHVPGPAVLALIAAGVVGAIVIARLRK